MKHLLEQDDIQVAGVIDIGRAIWGPIVGHSNAQQ